MAHNLIVNYGLCDNLDDGVGSAGRPAPHWGWSGYPANAAGRGAGSGANGVNGANGASDTFNGNGNASAGPSSNGGTTYPTFASTGPTTHASLPSDLSLKLAPGHRWADPSYSGAGQDSVLPQDSFMRLQNRAITLKPGESRFDRDEYGGRRMQVFRPRRANKGDMTRFHSDEYVELLEKVTPETVEALTNGHTRCELTSVWVVGGMGGEGRGASGIEIAARRCWSLRAMCPRSLAVKTCADARRELAAGKGTPALAATGRLYTPRDRRSRCAREA